MTEWVTTAELVGMPGMPRTIQGVRHRAKTESWPARDREVGKGVEHPVDCLPAETRVAIAARSASATDTPVAPALLLARAQATGDNTRAARRTVNRTEGTAAAANVTGERAAERDDKLRVLVCLERFRSKLGAPLYPSLQAFCESWNADKIDAPASARKRFPTLALTTVRDWYFALENHGGAGLTRPPSARAGKFAALDGELGQTVLALLHEYPHLGPEQIRRLASKALAGTPLGEALPARSSFKRAIAHWKAENAQVYSLVTNPDRWRSHYMSAAGSRSESVTGVNDLWEQDGTKGEVMLADGKRWTLTGNIDVYTRRLMVRLSASPRAAVVMALTREAIAEWGIPARIKTDNGSDYVASQYELALMQLAIEHPLCRPFNPQEKPHIERALGTLLHDLFELLPGYLGHNVAERSDIEARRSFADRLMKGTGEGGPVELRLTPEQLQVIIDNWLADYHAREHGGLAGKSPDQMLAEWAGTVHVADERALDIFLQPANESGLRTVGKKGIKLDHGWFNCAEIGGLEGQQVQVKQTESDLGVCYVFDLAGRYVGTAIDHARKGVSAAEVAAERREHQKRVMSEQKAALKAAVRAVKPQEMVMRVLQRKADEAVDASPNITRLRPTKEHTSEAIDSVLEHGRDQAAGVSPAVAATLKRLEQAEPLRPRAEVLDLTGNRTHRYSHCLRLQARMAAGEAIEPRELKWLDGYVTGSEFKALARLYQGKDPLAAEAGS